MSIHSLMIIYTHPRPLLRIVTSEYTSLATAKTKSCKLSLPESSFPLKLIFFLFVISHIWQSIACFRLVSPPLRGPGGGGGGTPLLSHIGMYKH